MRRGSPRHDPRFACLEVRRGGGSASQLRVDTLTAAFLPPRADGAKTARYRSVLTARRADVPLPPIEVYARCDAYDVVDAHHRVAAARALGYLYLDDLMHAFALPAMSDGNRRHNGCTTWARAPPCPASALGRA